MILKAVFARRRGHLFGFVPARNQHAPTSQVIIDFDQPIA